MDADDNRAEGWKYLNKQFFGDGLWIFIIIWSRKNLKIIGAVVDCSHKDMGLFTTRRILFSYSWLIWPHVRTPGSDKVGKHDMWR